MFRLMPNCSYVRAHYNHINLNPTKKCGRVWIKPGAVSKGGDTLPPTCPLILYFFSYFFFTLFKFNSFALPPPGKVPKPPLG